MLFDKNPKLKFEAMNFISNEVHVVLNSFYRMTNILESFYEGEVQVWF